MADTKRRKTRWGRMAAILAAIVLVFWISGCMERYFYYPTVEPTPPPKQFAGAASVWFNSGDGTRLHGWFIPAQGERDDAARAPTILHVHGNAGNMLHHFGFVDFLPAAGFNLFMFDYRGYGQSEGRPRSRAALIADAYAALDALLARSGVDPNQIGLFGQSLGGTIALNLMAERREIKAAIIESAFVSWREMAGCALGGETPGLLCRALAFVLIPDSHRADKAIARIDRSILLMHASEDTIIPCSNQQRLRDAASAEATVQLIEWPQGDHNSVRDSNPDYERTVADFFNTTLRSTNSTE